MDWQEMGLADEVMGWLDDAGRSVRTKERRLDPFATSMRDFDDVSANLSNVSAGVGIGHNDAQQRVTDLRLAGLVANDGGTVGLTALGQAVLDGWRQWNVANDDKQDELVRMMLVYGHARRLRAAPYGDYWTYWSELRAAFNELTLIDSWDRLFALNYLDFRRDGFAPGDAYRDARVAVDEIGYDLDAFAADFPGAQRAKLGASQVGKAIAGKVPRGRARATACLAMELLLRNDARREQLLVFFGTPRTPRVWTRFDRRRVDLALNVAASFGPVAARPASMSRGGAQTVQATPPRVLNLEDVLRPVPTRKAAAAGSRGGRRPRKIDHVRRQERNSEVGRLGELFALKYERWRLRGHPTLSRGVQHVSLDDDTLGYDIKSFDPDGSDRLVEVKSTEGPLSTRFFLSAGEYACAEALGDAYVILRVGNLRTDPVCCEIRWPFDSIELNTSTYECSFRTD